MKKAIMLLVVAATATLANAATVKWSAANIYGPDATTKYTGTASLYAVIDGAATLLNTASVSGGTISATATQFETTALTGGETYAFYVVIEDSSGKFTSAQISKLIQTTSTTTVGFGNMESQTKASGAWAAVPEPTSGLMLLLGVAGLALKRKRA